MQAASARPVGFDAATAGLARLRHRAEIREVGRDRSLRRDVARARLLVPLPVRVAGAQRFGPCVRIGRQDGSAKLRAIRDLPGCSPMTKNARPPMFRLPATLPGSVRTPSDDLTPRAASTACNYCSNSHMRRSNTRSSSIAGKEDHSQRTQKTRLPGSSGDSLQCGSRAISARWPPVPPALRNRRHSRNTCR